MKIGEILKKSVVLLEKRGFDSPVLEAEILLSFVLNKGREFFYSHPETRIGFFDNLKFRYLLHKRLSGWPVAYLIGSQGFYGLDFLVNKNVLIPRPETELMIDEALRVITNYRLSIINLIDVGTGSGCVSISLTKKLIEMGVKGNFYALDFSKKALKVAVKNSEKNKVAGCIKFLHSDLLNVIDFKKFNGPIFITANLPYLTKEQVDNSKTIKKEPRLALLSGVDGLDHYRRLFKQIKDSLLDIKEDLTVFCEIDETQTTPLSVLVKEVLPTALLEVKKDLGGFDRLIIVSIKKG